MRRHSRNFILFITACFLTTACLGGELSESEIEAFFDFIRSVDPQNVLGVSWNETLSNPCSNKLKGIVCDSQGNSITEIRFQNLNLSGVLDVESLCKLENLQVLSLAKNLIRGNVPDSISNCRRLTYLDLSSNLLSGRLTLQALSKLENLRTLDISNNHFSGSVLISEQDFTHQDSNSLKPTANQMYIFRKLLQVVNSESLNGSNNGTGGDRTSDESSSGNKNWLPFVIGIPFIILFLLVVYYIIAKLMKVAREKELVKTLAQSPQIKSQLPVPKAEEIIKPADERSELVFFVEEQETFKLGDLFEAAADLRSHSFYSSLYKVMLKNNAAYAVKRLKKLQISFEEFGRVMRHIGNLKHPNILALVGYNSTVEEKLLIYKYQSNGSLLNLLEDHVEGRKVFPWKLRLSIAIGVARGLEFIYQNSQKKEIIPHGNLKSSNILLDENQEPVISEYGLITILDSQKPSNLYISNGYAAPEKKVSEQGDVYSFGIILLELLTGKTVEKSGIDLPKWVRSKVREEWTGEVFDKEVNNAAREYAFSLLNIALKCVSNSPEDRPNMAEVIEKIEEIVNTHDDVSISTFASMESSPQECCLLHTVIPETWDTPGSNY